MTDEQFLEVIGRLVTGLGEIPALSERQIAMQKQLDRVEGKLDKQNGKMHAYGEDIAVLQDRWRTMGEPTAKTTADLRESVAKLAVQAVAFGGAAGAVMKLAEALAKAM